MLWKQLEKWSYNIGSSITLLCSVKPVFLAAKGRKQPLLATLKVKMIMYRRALRKFYSIKQSKTKIFGILQLSGCVYSNVSGTFPVK